MALKWRLRKDFVVEGGTTFVKKSSLLVYDTIQGERENINVSVDDALDPPVIDTVLIKTPCLILFLFLSLSPSLSRILP